MRRIRIIKRTEKDGDSSYVIQKKGIFFGWNDCKRYRRGDKMGKKVAFVEWDTLEEAQQGLYHFDGTKKKEKVVAVVCQKCGKFLMPDETRLPHDCCFNIPPPPKLTEGKHKSNRPNRQGLPPKRVS